MMGEIELPEIRVPEQHKAGFLAVRDLTDDEFAALAQALEKADPTEGVPVEELARLLEASVPRLGKREARRLIRALLSVEIGRAIHGDSLGGFANGIATSETLDLLPETAADLAARVESLARVPAIAIAAKAMDIAGEHDLTFHSARVLTDIRPVFGDEATQPPVGAVVTHVLRLDAFRRGQLEEVYVALDTKDLLELQAVVRRAIEKNESLNQVLDNIGFSRFQLSEEG